MRTLTPVPTSYAGHRFRSRLEARWAVFFDTLGVAWQYEPEAFVLPSGQRYLPDFRLPEQQAWVEVKPSDTDDMSKTEEFAECVPTSDRVFGFLGPIPPVSHINCAGQCYMDPCCAHIYLLAPGWDNSYAWCTCSGRHYDLQFEARSARMTCGCRPYEPGGRGENGAHPKILAAYTAANTRRFWDPVPP